MIVIITLCIASSSRSAKGCDGANTWVYYSDYALRLSADSVKTYSQVYTSGPDEAYMYTFVTQNDYFNGASVASSISGSASPGYTAWTSRTTSVDHFGFGTYSTTMQASAYDGCTGLSSPPYINGATGILSKSLSVSQPSISGSSRLWLHNYDGVNFPTSTLWTADTGGAPETPTWTITSGFADTRVILSCTTCASLTLTAAALDYTSCAPAATLYYEVGNLKSPEVSVYVFLSQMASATDPTTGQHIVHNAVTAPLPVSTEITKAAGATLATPAIVRQKWTGYVTNIYWKMVDPCGYSIPDLPMHEEFPNGFTYDSPDYNWGFPTANSWTASSGTVWYDMIGESSPVLTATGMVPTLLAPQNPLTSLVVYSGRQMIYAGQNASDTDNTLNYDTTQVHYQDHGGYR